MARKYNRNNNPVSLFALNPRSTLAKIFDLIHNHNSLRFDDNKKRFHADFDYDNSEIKTSNEAKCKKIAM